MSYLGTVNLSVDIPREVIEKMLISIDIRDIEHFCSANKEISYICQDDEFWKKKVTADHPEIISPLQKNWRYTARLLEPKTITVRETIDSYSYETGNIDTSTNKYTLLFDPSWDMNQLNTELYVLSSNVANGSDTLNTRFHLGNLVYEYIVVEDDTEFFRLSLVDIESGGHIKPSRLLKLDVPLWSIVIDGKNFSSSLKSISLHYTFV